MENEDNICEKCCKGLEDGMSKLLDSNYYSENTFIRRPGETDDELRKRIKQHKDSKKENKNE